MDDSAFLLELAIKLKAVRSRGLATQTAIEARTGIDQGTISKVLNGKRKRVNDRLRALDKYANILLEDVTLSPQVTEAAREFLTFGSEAELVDSIRHCTRLVAHRIN
ncbi:helix-turn-helix transcriptional regulator [Qipengyuania sp. DY56-A-20]|jgi:transcriptional regulator with XRE-family HTH domain|uniref:Helix-turn-helix transcriptional regulator n=1 Tax=Qipengyuania benthica TaxID=3067651 RepID=A0ABT9HAK0_9SPHN|nr:helix-turn-helix transcriptional regulator [Qipengyuania sp. DY56-A-20]MDP4540344.1 helix-turn-helix transcriptional regulator [Qipengyuania sp. DY56-A-20]